MHRGLTAHQDVLQLGIPPYHLHDKGALPSGFQEPSCIAAKGLCAAAAKWGTCHGSRRVQVLKALGDVDEPLQPLLLTVVFSPQVTGPHLLTAMWTTYPHHSQY